MPSTYCLFSFLDILYIEESLHYRIVKFTSDDSIGNFLNNSFQVATDCTKKDGECTLYIRER